MYKRDAQNVYVYMYMYMYRYMYMYMNMYMYMYMHIAEASIASKRCRERLRRRMLGRFRGDMSSKGDQDAILKFFCKENHRPKL